MFEHIRLITKKDNKISDPNISWNAKSKIHCCCELNFGLGEKFTWTQHHSIPLTRLIKFYNELLDSITGPLGKEHQYLFPNNYGTIVILWSTEDRSGFNFTFRYRSYNYDEEVYRKTISSSLFYFYKRSLFFTVMQVLIKNSGEEACVRAGELFYGSDRHPYEFKMGQRVKTAAHVKKQRIGYIMMRFYHEKRKTNVYQLMLNDRIYERWFWPADLERYNAAE
ncbi:hypothetical protein [Niastella sp. OAS944]|uniref:hypothetical protein n=1 Tax=Niastella sp. OAS944 TaxID=2664089 RepID=UPI003487EB6B|nr:hypothetical protein [Chitinophagaceae bacterium OAS944]